MLRSIGKNDNEKGEVKKEKRSGKRISKGEEREKAFRGVRTRATRDREKRNNG